MCDHSFLQRQQQQQLENMSSLLRACVGKNESYISVGSQLNLVQSIGESTAVTALNFVIRYEFVDTRQDGMPAAG